MPHVVVGEFVNEYSNSDFAYWWKTIDVSVFVAVINSLEKTMLKAICIFRFFLLYIKEVRYSTHFVKFPWSSFLRLSSLCILICLLFPPSSSSFFKGNALNLFCFPRTNTPFAVSLMQMMLATCTKMYS